jgi:trans-2,3-dihydro-3-hydroxyanthranilate isomerase
MRQQHWYALPVRSYRYLHLDVFTDRPFAGNQLAVVLDGRGLTDIEMQAIARELNFSETTFVVTPERIDTDARLRIFTPESELPIAGHPTVGSAFALARAGVIVPGRDTFVFGLNIGPTPVSLTWRGNDLGFVWMAQPLPTFGEPVGEPRLAAAALGLPEAAVSGTGLPVQMVSCGVPYLFVPIASRRAVDNAYLDRAAAGAFYRAAKTDEMPIFLFSPERGSDKATVYSRMFAPGIGITEDPATGSASGPLGCYLLRHHVVPPAKAGSMLSLQGVKMGRPSYVHIAIALSGSAVSGVRVGGEAVLAGEGTIYVP